MSDIVEVLRKAAAGIEKERAEISAEFDSLRAEVERLRADLDATNAALREFGHHDGRCSITDLDSDGNHCACDCGLSVALGDQAPEQGGGN